MVAREDFRLASPILLRKEPSVAEFTGSGLLDLTAMPIAELPQLDEETFGMAIDRLIQPCGGQINEDVSAIDGQARMWQNYKTPD